MTNGTSSTTLEIKDLAANGLVFRCRVCGLENSGEPVILLHGFPETSHMWEGIMLALAAQGYRCLAPDQRGYSPEARPVGIEHYTIDQIAADVIALADSLEFGKFHLVGHDWGSGCGWTVVQLYPERVSSWSALSVPHLAAFTAAKEHDPDQKRRSWYMGFFQTPRLPEMVLKFVAANLHSALWKFSTKAEIADYLTVFSTFEGLQATINWYRANQILPIQYGDVFLPTLMIWGNKDAAIGRQGVEMTRPYIKGEYTYLELDAEHMLVQEKFEPVKQAILEQIQRHPIHN